MKRINKSKLTGGDGGDGIDFQKTILQQQFTDRGKYLHRVALDGGNQFVDFVFNDPYGRIPYPPRYDENGNKIMEDRYWGRDSNYVDDVFPLTDKQVTEVIDAMTPVLEEYCARYKDFFKTYPTQIRITNGFIGGAPMIMARGGVILVDAHALRAYPIYRTLLLHELAHSFQSTAYSLPTVGNIESTLKFNYPSQLIDWEKKWMKLSKEVWKSFTPDEKMALIAKMTMEKRTVYFPGFADGAYCSRYGLEKINVGAVDEFDTWFNVREDIVELKTMMLTQGGRRRIIQSLDRKHDHYNSKHKWLERMKLFRKLHTDKKYLKTLSEMKPG